MPLPKISEARELSDEKLSDEILAVKKQLIRKTPSIQTCSTPFSPVADSRGRAQNESN
jgi:hypothetical protein